VDIHHLELHHLTFHHSHTTSSTTSKKGPDRYLYYYVFSKYGSTHMFMTCLHPAERSCLTNRMAYRLVYSHWENSDHRFIHNNNHNNNLSHQNFQVKSIPYIIRNFSRYLTTSPLHNTSRYLLVQLIDILYTLDSASNYSAIQKLKPWLQTQDIPMK
jgi:hypothetical protein